MKTPKCFLAFIGTLLFFSLVLSSCRTAKIAAVSCPEFSGNKNNKVAVDNIRNRNRNKEITAHSGVTIKRQPLGRSSGLSENNRRKDIVVINNSHVLENIIVPDMERVNGLSKIEYSKGLTASIDNEIIPSRRNNATALSLKKIDMAEQSEDLIITQPACDTIILKSGAVVIGKVTEIGLYEIRYRKCDNLDGPIISISKSDIYVIKYPNGTRDFFTSTNVAVIGENNSTKEFEIFGIIGFALSLRNLFLFPFGLISLILGIVSLIRIKRNPDKYKGKKLAIATIILGSIYIILIIGLISWMAATGKSFI